MPDDSKKLMTTGRKIGFACRIVLLVLLALLVLFSVILIVQSVVSGDRMSGLLRPSVEQDVFMSPTVKRGDFLLLRSVKGGIKINDVVSYRTESGFALGRVLSVDEKSLTVKGDAEADAFSVTIAKENVRGIWNGFRIPLIGYLIIWVQTATGCLLIILALLLIDVLVSVLIQRKTKKENNGDEDSYIGFGICGILLIRGWRSLRSTIMQKQKSRKGRTGT